MELSFDIRGNLQPYKVITISFEDFQQAFVDSFDPESSRHRIFENYMNYLQELQNILRYDFHQWVNGSFVSNKVHPKDIDLVTVIDYRDHEKQRKNIERKFISRKARDIFNVDAYIVPQYPISHIRHSFYQSDLAYWRNLFGKTRVNRAKRQFEKGFVQLNFKKDG